jgi:hypothetical protein
MMRKLFGTLFILALACAGPAQAQQDRPGLLGGGRATPNFLGTTGLLMTPSAYTVGERGAAAHAHGASHFWSAGAQVGPVDRLEVGASYLSFEDDCGCDDNAVFLNAKYMLLREGRAMPALSVGVVDALDELDLRPSWYFVLSKDIGRLVPLSGLGLRAHLGFGDGLYDLEPFAGLELDFGNFTDATPLTRVRTSLMLETMNGDVNLGLRAKWKGLGITFGVFDFNEIGGGISYTTGLRL